MNTLNALKKRPLIGKILRAMFFVIGGSISLLLILTIVFYIYRDQIAENLVLKVNDIQNGEVSFSGISFSPFVQFPDMSVKLNDFKFVYLNPLDSLHRTDTIASIKNLYVASDLWSLFSGRVVFSGIKVSDGKLSLHTYPDSTINLMHALGMYDEKQEVIQAKEKDTLAVKEAFEISLGQVSLNNVDVEFTKSTGTDTTRVSVNYLSSTLEYQSDELSCKLNAAVSVKELAYLKEKRYGPLPITLNTGFLFDTRSGELKVDFADLKIYAAHFSLTGGFVFADTVSVDLSVEASNADMSFFRLWLSEKGLSNLKSGESYFSGTVKGQFNGQIPRMVFDFGMRNVNLDIPGVTSHISDLALAGTFNSGILPDFSDARLEISKFSGQLPGGYVNGNLSMFDFTAPQVRMLWDLEAEISGFDEILNISSISKLNGKVRFFDQAEGRYDPATKAWLEKKNESSLVLDSVSVDIAGFGSVSSLSGSLFRNHDTLSVSDLRFMTGNSDFWIDGTINNLLGLFIEKEDPITAQLKIKSDTFDLPSFLSFDPRIGESFPYRILGVDLDVTASSSRDKLLVFESNPEIEFDIAHLTGTIEGLFPEVVIRMGRMLLAENEGRTHLSFDDFIMNVADGEIETDVIFHSPAGKPDHLVVDAAISGLNPGLLFFDRADTVPPIAQGILMASAHADLELKNDSIDFEHLLLELKSLDYTTKSDTIHAAGFVLEAMDVQYSGNDNPFASLTAAIEVQAQAVQTNYFEVKDVAYSIDASVGNFTVYPERVQFFDKEGEGVYEFSPFAPNPVYKVKYRVNNFRVETLLQKFFTDTVISGPMDINLDLLLSVSDQIEPMKGLNGSLNLYGRDLVIYGMDLDNLIKKYKRSQKFNLVDLGAVALAGPFGLAITKGSQFASLAIGEFGESTGVVEVVSEWTCENGRFNIIDVAFTTEENLVAGKGWVDLTTDSLNITVAVLNKYKCNVVSQSVYGKLSDPEYSEVNIVETLLGPVTNLVDGSQGKGCNPFYAGRLNHPLTETQKSKN